MGLFSFLKRGGKVVEAHANDALDNIEGKDPVVMAKQAIRDMEKEYAESVTASASIKANFVKSKAVVKSVEDEISTWKKQADALKAKYKEMNAVLENENSTDENKANANEVIVSIRKNVGEALDNTKHLEIKLVEKKEYSAKAKKRTENMDKRLKELTRNIETMKDELQNMKAQTEMAEAELTINKNMNSNVSGSAQAMFDRMKENADNLEAEAEAYGDLADGGKSTQDEINDILNMPTPGSVDKESDDFLNS